MKAPVINLDLITQPSPYIVQNWDGFWISVVTQIGHHNIYKRQT